MYGMTPIGVFFLAVFPPRPPNQGFCQQLQGVEKAYHCFQKAGLRDVTMKLYHGLRHEILNESGKQYVYRDVLDWLEARS